MPPAKVDPHHGQTPTTSHSLQYATNDAARKGHLRPSTTSVPTRKKHRGAGPVAHQSVPKLAKLLGYSDWAAYITEDKMVASKQNAADFIERSPWPPPPARSATIRICLTFKKRTDPKTQAVIKPLGNGCNLEHGSPRSDKYGFRFASPFRPYLEYSRVKPGQSLI